MPRPTPPPPAAQQDGLFTRRQARAAGLSTRRIRTQLDMGRWQCVLGDVLVPAGTTITTRLRARAAVLATQGVLSHASAANLWGMPIPRDDASLHVTVPVAAHPRVEGVRLHRRQLGPGEVSWLYGISVTSRLRTVVDCLSTWPEDHAGSLLDHVLRTRVAPLAQIQSVVADTHHTHGVEQLRRLVEQAAAGSWSAAERHLHDLLRSAGITGWVANHRLRTDDGRAVVVDVWFESARLAIEVDGQAWHVSAERFQRDRARQNSLVLSGCTVLRCPAAAPRRLLLADGVCDRTGIGATRCDEGYHDRRPLRQRKRRTALVDEPRRCGTANRESECENAQDYSNET